MDTNTGITPVMPIGGMSDGFGGGNAFVWIFGLLILLGLFNGSGFGVGGGNSNAIQNDINRGFDSQNLQAQTRDILSAVTAGTAQSVAAANNVYHDVVGYVGDKYSELARDVAGIAVGQANLLANQNACCCETKQMVMQSNYDSALRDANTNANLTAQIQGVKDMIAQNKIESLQARVNALQLNAAMCGVVRWPLSATYSTTNPFCPGTTASTGTGA